MCVSERTRVHILHVYKNQNNNKNVQNIKYYCQATVAKHFFYKENVYDILLLLLKLFILVLFYQSQM